MRTTHPRKIQIQPIKSPSPDTANRSCIQGTIAPIKQIQIYRQSRSRSPRLSNSTIHHPSLDVHHLKHQIYTLKQQIKILKDRQSQNQPLYQKNNTLMQETFYLKSELDRFKKIYLETPYQSPNYTNTLQNDKLFNELNQTLIKISEENKRLSQKTQDLGQTVDFLNKQNQMLKNQVTFYKKSTPNLINQYGYPSIPRKTMEQACRQLQISAEQRQIQFENYIQNKIQEIELKINKIKILQNVIEQKIQKQKLQSSRLNNLSTPSPTPKLDYSNGTTWRGDNLNSPMRLSIIREAEEKLRAENIILANKASILANQIDHLRQQCNDRNRHINSLQFKIKQLTQKLQKQYQNINNYKNIADPKKPTYPSDINILGQTELTFLKQKIKYLELDLKDKSNTITNLQQQNSLKDKQCSKIQSRLDQANYLLQHQISNFQKIIDQSKIKYQILQKQNSNLSNKINQIQNEKDNELSQMKQQLSKFPKIVNDMKYFEQQASKKSIMLTNALKEYLQLIKQIKLTLSSEKIDKFIIDINSADENLLSMQKMKAQSMNLIAQLRKKLLTKQAQILELKKDNAMLISQIEHMQTQKSKLKQLIQSYTSGNTKYNISISSQIKYPTHKNLKISCNLKQCLQQAVTGITKLQSQVNAHLSQLSLKIQP